MITLVSIPKDKIEASWFRVEQLVTEALLDLEDMQTKIILKTGVFKTNVSYGFFGMLKKL